MNFIKKYCIYLSVIFFISCSFETSELKKGMWKYCGGYYIGDVFNTTNMSFINDTIYINSIPKALIISKKESFLGATDRKVIIRSLESNEEGTYCGK